MCALRIGVYLSLKLLDRPIMTLSILSFNAVDKLDNNMYNPSGFNNKFIGLQLYDGRF